MRSSRSRREGATGRKWEGVNSLRESERDNKIEWGRERNGKREEVLVR